MVRRRKPIRRTRSFNPPKIYRCPKCGKEAVKIKLFREEGVGYGKCGVCLLTAEGFLEEIYEPRNQKSLFGMFPAIEPVDFYCHFIMDGFNQAEKAIPS